MDENDGGKPEKHWQRRKIDREGRWIITGRGNGVSKKRNTRREGSRLSRRSKSCYKKKGEGVDRVGDEGKGLEKHPVCFSENKAVATDEE